MIKKLKKFFKFWLPPIIWATLIFILSSRSLPRTTEIYWGDFIFKKSAHIFEYGVLSIFLYRALKNYGFNSRNTGIIAIALSVIYGAMDEFHQSFTPGREPRVRDVIFDTIGATFSIYFIWNLLPKASSKLKKLAKKLQIIS